MGEDVAGRRKRVAIVQSCYIPWKGYFDMINAVDEFILYDDRQFTRRDWRNRNRIKTSRGPQWLSIPVEVKGRYHQRIDETRIADPAWAARHVKTLRHAYAGAPRYDEYAEWLDELYAGAASAWLSEVNRWFLDWICAELGISTPLRWSTEFDVGGAKSERLVELCLATGATHYLSGPSAKAYLEEQRFAAAGICVEYMDYAGYPPYEQVHPPFDHAVTIIDLILHEGQEAPSYMKSFSHA